jgi:membrane protease YdiL (CAAX protease family)
MENRQDNIGMESGIEYSGLTQKHNMVAALLLGGLLFLRIALLGIVGCFIKSVWVDASFQTGTYLLTAILICWERERLEDFHIDGLALWLIILFKPLQTLILVLLSRNHPLAFPNPLCFFIWGIAIGLALSLRSSKSILPQYNKSSFRWFGIGALAGMATAILLGYPLSLQIDKSRITQRPEVISVFFSSIPVFLYQIGYAAVSEEPLFRGFLWGYLRKLKWKEAWIWLFQAGLFSLAHIYYINKYPYSFWIVVPVGALVMGFMAWCSRSISTSMATHGALNTLGVRIATIIAYYTR